MQPVCDDASARAELLEGAAQSVGGDPEVQAIGRRIALDVIEYVAQVCGGSGPDAALALLEATRSVLGPSSRLAVLEARTLAVADRLEPAKEAAERAAEKGSTHAVPLLAQIEARIARRQGVGYAEGMLDAAIRTVSVEPNLDWPGIDVAAVLSTRARLLLERALWRDAQRGESDRDQAATTLERMIDGPLPFEVRRRAADLRCFEAADRGQSLEPCQRAARVFGSAGAAALADEDAAGKGDLLAARQRLAEPLDGPIIVLARGDEPELLEWARPLARLLSRWPKADVVAVDRTDGPRAAAVVKRSFELAGVKPKVWVDGTGPRSAGAVSCVAALLAERRRPASCPIEEADALESLPRAALAILVGRDLDAEIDDLKLYEHRMLLLSFRKSSMGSEGLEAWLKNVSDVFALLP